MRLRLWPTLFFALFVLTTMFGAGVLIYDATHMPRAEATSIGGGRAGNTGPTGPAWTTCAQMASSMGDETGTCGGAVLSVAPQLTGAVGISGTASITGSVGITGTSGATGLVVIGNGNGPGGYFIGGVGSGTPAGLTVQAGGSVGSLGTPTITTAALIVQGRSGGYGISAKGGNSNGAIAAYFEGTGTNGQAFNAVGHIGLTSAAYTAGTTQTQAGATNLTTTLNRVTTGNANDGVALPQGQASTRTCVWIDNISAVVMKLYPNNADNDTINGLAADASVDLAALGSTWACTSDGTAWITGNLD